MWLLFKTKLLIYQSKANLDVKILFGKIIRHLDPAIRKNCLKDKFGNQDSTFRFGP